MWTRLFAVSGVRLRQRVQSAFRYFERGETVEAFRETIVSKVFLDKAIEAAALTVAIDVLRADCRGPGMDKARGEDT
jgi:hypothetical protein